MVIKKSIKYFYISSHNENSSENVDQPKQSVPVGHISALRVAENTESAVFFISEFQSLLYSEQSLLGAATNNRVEDILEQLKAVVNDALHRATDEHYDVKELKEFLVDLEAELYGMAEKLDQLDNCGQLIESVDVDHVDEDGENQSLKMVEVLQSRIDRVERKMIAIRNEVARHSDWLANPKKDEPLSNSFDSLKTLQNRVRQFGYVNLVLSDQEMEKNCKEARAAVKSIKENLQELLFQEI